MDKQKPKITCPNCGSDQYVVNHAGGSTTTFLMCKTCGNKGTREAWETMKNNGDSFDIKAFNLRKIKTATGIANSNELASDKPSIENDPELGHKRKKTEERRINNIDRLRDKRYDSEHIKANSLGDINKMAFNLKKFKANKTIKAECDCFSEHGNVCEEDMCDDCKKKIKTDKSAKKSFNLMKIAREFRWTEDQKYRKNELGKNMVFPEGRQDIKTNKTDGGNKENNKSEQEKYIGVEENRRFDTVDRKDMHRSPDPRKFIPGYNHWYEKEIDKYYDGWLDDHIENSGGKVVGSNTEKTMNLNDNERYHAPIYPIEASYERLLENRHNFDDDYERKIAFNLLKIKKAQVPEGHRYTDFDTLLNEPIGGFRSSFNLSKFKTSKKKT